MSVRSYLLFIEDIVESVHKISDYLGDSEYDDFAGNSMLIDAVIRNPEIIGEAAGKIPQEIKDNWLQVPWNRMIGLRNIVAHEYFGIDLEIIWRVIETDLPSLLPLLEEMEAALK